MSKPLCSFLSTALLVLTMLPGGVFYAQHSTATLGITGGERPSVAVQVTTKGRRNLSVLRSIAGAGDLQTRITNIRLADFVSRAPVSFRELQAGEYLAEKDFSLAQYDVDLSPHKQRQAAAHVSWMKDDVGVLMLTDLLPIPNKGPLSVSFSSESPTVRSVELNGEQRSAVLADPENSVFFVGEGWRRIAVSRCRGCPTLFLSGSWLFSDDDAAKFLADIAAEYKRIFGSAELPHAQVGIAKFPVPTQPGIWEAETRGRSVLIISSDMPFASQSIQRLHEQLRHEIFHLWIPNGVSLKGNYDWFYEGFALYRSLKLAVAMNRIRFDDFLDTLSRAHTIDSAFTQRPSLVDASKNRFSGLNTQVYARGMLVAFLTDLAMMEGSKNSIDNLLRELYRRHPKSAESADGNEAVMSLMSQNPSVKLIVERYVTGRETINWNSELAAAGIEDSDAGPITNLRVKEKPGGKQKAMLDKLGYNNWRKLAPNSK